MASYKGIQGFYFRENQWSPTAGKKRPGLGGGIGGGGEPLSPGRG